MCVSGGLAQEMLPCHCITMLPPFDLNSPADWLSLGPRLVGLTFIYAGAIKAIAPHTFQNHLRSLGWLRWNLVSPAVTAATGLEAGWGVALLTGAATAFVYPATIMMLVVLTFTSWWGVHSGKAKDCGCYGGYIQPSISQSISINATFALLIALAWAARTPSLAVSWWQLALILVVGIGLAGMAEAAQRFENRNGRLMFDTSPLKIGRKWKHAWADGATTGVNGEVLVAYLGTNCPYCSQFVKVANAMVQSPTLPRVVGVISAPDEEVQAYINDYGIRFPVSTVSQSLMGRLTRAVPTAVIVKSGRIEDMWIGNMPPAIVDRFRDAFFPNLAKPVARVAG